MFAADHSTAPGPRKSGWQADALQQVDDRAQLRRVEVRPHDRGDDAGHGVRHERRDAEERLEPSRGVSSSSAMTSATNSMTGTCTMPNRPMRPMLDQNSVFWNTCRVLVEAAERRVGRAVLAAGAAHDAEALPERVADRRQVEQHEREEERGHERDDGARPGAAAASAAGAPGRRHHVDRAGMRCQSCSRSLARRGRDRQVLHRLQRRRLGGRERVGERAVSGRRLGHRVLEARLTVFWVGPQAKLVSMFLDDSAKTSKIFSLL